jgi:hypothetical protein
MRDRGNGEVVDGDVGRVVAQLHADRSAVAIPGEIAAGDLNPIDFQSGGHGGAVGEGTEGAGNLHAADHSTGRGGECASTPLPDPTNDQPKERRQNWRDWPLLKLSGGSTAAWTEGAAGPQSEQQSEKVPHNPTHQADFLPQGTDNPAFYVRIPDDYRCRLHPPRAGLPEWSIRRGADLLGKPLTWKGYFRYFPP